MSTLPRPSLTVPVDRGPLSLDDAAAVDELRRSSASTSLYRALLGSLPDEDQRWVLDAVERHQLAEREAEQRGVTLAGPAW